MSKFERRFDREGGAYLLFQKGVRAHNAQIIILEDPHVVIKTVTER